MIKRISLILSSMLIFSVIAIAQTDFPSGLTTATRQQISNTGLTVTDGDVLVQGNLYQVAPLFNPQIVYLDLATGSNTSFKNTAISTATLVAAVTTFTLANGDYTNTIVPRNIIVLASCTVNGLFVGSALVTGVDTLGRARTETIVVGTTATVSTGNIAWSSITSIALTTTSTTASAVSIQIGSGVKIGVPAKLSAASEILKVIEAGALTTTYTYSTTYNTITFVNAPDGSKDYTLYLKPINR